MKYQLKFVAQIIAAVLLVSLSDTVLRTFGDLLFMGPVNLTGFFENTYYYIEYYWCCKCCQYD
jgi:hypothetical protein